MHGRDETPKDPADRSIENAWKRLEAWFAEHHPEPLEHLNPGADEAALRRYETATGHRLPPDVRRSFLIHDGEAQGATGVVFGLRLLPLSESLRQWQGWREVAPMFASEADREEYAGRAGSLPEGAIKAEYTNPAWLPLTEDGGGNHLGADLDPGPAGTGGQIITFGRDEELKAVAARDWTTFLHGLADLLQSGNYSISPDSGFTPKSPPLHYHDFIKERLKQTH